MSLSWRYPNLGIPELFERIQSIVLLHGIEQCQVFMLHRQYVRASVAQWIRHRPPKPGIVGSSPTGGEVLLWRQCIFLLKFQFEIHES